MKEDKTMRLAKYLSNAGIASRRRCEELIAEGRVTVNGKTVTTVCLITPGEDVVAYEGATITIGAKEYYIFNKPVGYTCTASDPHAKRIIYDLLPENMKPLFYVGRLDKDTEGLLVMTNDGELTQCLSHPSNCIEKKYIADVSGDFSNDIAKQMTDGITDEGELLKAQRVKLLRMDEGHFILEIVLTEGKKREVRRLCAATGLKVNRLARVSLGNLQLGDLPSGEFRKITDKELFELKKLCGF